MNLIQKQTAIGAIVLITTLGISVLLGAHLVTTIVYKTNG